MTIFEMELEDLRSEFREYGTDLSDYIREDIIEYYKNKYSQYMDDDDENYIVDALMDHINDYPIECRGVENEFGEYKYYDDAYENYKNEIIDDFKLKYHLR